MSRDGTFDPTGVPPGIIGYPRVSPDGRAIAFLERAEGAREQWNAVRIFDLARGSTVRRGGGDAALGAAVWQPGTGALTLGGRKGTVTGVFLDAPDGPETWLLPNAPGPVALFDLDTTSASGEPATYAVGFNGGVGYDVLPDGRFVMVRQPDQRTTREIVLVRNWLDALKRANTTR